jgi:glutathione S-transferase
MVFSLMLTCRACSVEPYAYLLARAHPTAAKRTSRRHQGPAAIQFRHLGIHAGCSPLFSSDIPEKVKDIIKEKFYKRLDNLDATLSRKDYL